MPIFETAINEWLGGMEHNFRRLNTHIFLNGFICIHIFSQWVIEPVWICCMSSSCLLMDSTEGASHLMFMFKWSREFTAVCGTINTTRAEKILQRRIKPKITYADWLRAEPGLELQRLVNWLLVKKIKLFWKSINILTAFQIWRFSIFLCYISY